MNKILPLACSYNRKSSEDKKNQIQSIPDQINITNDLAKRYGYKILEEDVFQESKSANKLPIDVIIRTEFNTMVKNIWAGKFDTIFCWKADRLARNPIDGGTLLAMLMQGQLKKIITSDKVYTIADYIMLTFEFGMATKYSMDLSDNVIRGHDTKRRKGWRPGLAPLGYTNDKYGDDGDKKIFKDPKRFDIVKKIFEHMVTGVYTVPELLKKANDEWGLTVPANRKFPERPLSRTGLYQILSNLFYCGEYIHDKEIIKGQHPAMITPNEFDKIQLILGRRGKQRPQKREFAYSTYIRCGECGFAVVGELKHKQLKDGAIKLYTLYHCSHKRKDYYCTQRKSIHEEALEEQIKEKLSSISMPQTYIDWGIERLQEYLQQGFKENDSDIAKLKVEYEKQKEMIRNLIDEKTSGKWSSSEEDFVDTKERYIKRRDQILKQIEETEHEDDKKTDETLDMLNFCKRAIQEYEEGDMYKKREIFIRLGSHFSLKDGKLDIQYKKSIFRLKTELDSYRDEYARFAPTESIDIKGKLPPIEVVSTRFLGN